MRRSVTAVGLVLTLSASSAFAGDLRQAAHVAALREVQAQGQTGQRGAMPPGLKWSGIGLLIGGGVTVLIGAAIKADNACVYTAVNDDCDAIANGFYIFGGALAGTGAVLLGVANAKRERLPAITVRRGGVAIRQRVSF